MTSRPELSVSFHNFWPGFDPKRFFLTRELMRRFDIRFDLFGRDLQFFSVFGKELVPAKGRERALRVWFSGEAAEPSRMIYDLHFGSLPESLLGRRWVRCPVWSSSVDWWDATSPYSPEKLLGDRRFEQRDKFCNFIYSNRTSFRTEFFDMLGRRRRVDSCGRVLNNIGAPCADKFETVSAYQFTIAFENALSPGYVTEKLIDPLAARSIPIYWGASEGRSDFNPEAFIFARDFETFDDLADHVVRLSESREEMERIVTAPVFRDNRFPDQFATSHYVDLIVEALSAPQTTIERHLLNDTLIADQPGYARKGKRLERFGKRVRKRLARLSGLGSR
ncbi:glycosyltransferase family 10 [Parvibaculum sp.]|uniref:glycosyltransferase family 10 domain-containing protein n=1 Tax=Parvibaculum sp. TaxID=2024848 RepID=UPI00320D1C3E